MALVTIVTPSFNRAWSISSCIQSLQAQTFGDYEHIVVDGGSTDGTLEVLHDAALSDSRIRYLSEPDLGIYDAVNKGMRIASSEIVAYLNTDDFYLPHTLQYVVSAFSRNPDASLIYGHWLSWHPESSFLELQPVFRYTAADMAVFAVLPQPSVFFKKKVYDRLDGFDLSYKLLSDNDFFSRVVISSRKIIHLDHYLSIQTIHSTNMLAGNGSAVLIAKEEANSYRFKRMQEIANKQSQYAWKFLLIIASIRHILLPFAWRLNLLVRIAKLNVICTPEFRLRQLCLDDLSINYVTFFHYLAAKFSRHQFAFWTVKNSDTIRFIGFSLPPAGVVPKGFMRDDI
jgi:glycosyltransferase involved in cell wall biosynthesis